MVRGPASKVKLRTGREQVESALVDGSHNPPEVRHQLAMHHLHALLLNATLVATAFSLSPQATQAVAARVEEPSSRSAFFPTPSRGLVIHNRETQTLADLVKEFAAVTGENVMYSAETEGLLKQASTQLIADLDVAPEDVYSVVQDVLSMSRFGLLDVRRANPRILSVVSLDSLPQGSIMKYAHFVPGDRLADYFGDSALLITTEVELPHLDVRTLGASMRQLVVDPRTMQMIPIPENHSLLFTGFGGDVHRLSGVLQRLDRRAAQPAQRSRKESPSTHLRNDTPAIGGARLGLPNEG